MKPDDNFDRAERKLLRDIHDRTKRIETRFTKYMEDQGFDTKVRRPFFDDVGGGEFHIEVPSPSTSLKDILSVVPASITAEDELHVYHGETLLAVIFLPQ